MILVRCQGCEVLKDRAFVGCVIDEFENNLAPENSIGGRNLVTVGCDADMRLDLLTEC